ncbi:MAG: ferredoxin--NADP reductase [Pseudomonadota bacterium]
MDSSTAPDADAAPVTAPAADIAVPNGVFALKVLSVRHYTDRLFSFRVERPASFRFRSGEFVMISLPAETKPIYRAYSIASPSWDEEIEFFSIKVPGGPLTEHLQKITPGDSIWMRQKPTGTLVLDCLVPGKRLFMLSTGTGVAPFASLVRDPDAYEMFDALVLTHTCREGAELQYGRDVVTTAKDDPLVGEFATDRLHHFASTTREQSDCMGRVTALIETGELFDRLSMSPLDPEHDRVMLCGSMDMINELKEMLEARGFEEGANNKPATFVVERAFVG